MSRTFGGEKRPMQNAVQITEVARSAAIALVACEQRRVGSRMTAYGRVAASVGASASWIRKFIGRNPDAKPNLEIGFNILRLYGDLCTRVELEQACERARVAALREQINAAFPGALDVVARAAGTPAPRTMAAQNRPAED